MKVLVECFWYKEGGPYFAYGAIEGLIKNGVEVYALTTDLMENKTLWNGVLDQDHIFYWEGLPQKNKPLSYMKNLLKIKHKFKDILFDYVLITFPGRSDVIISHFLRYKQNIMILHDVIPHSSTREKTTEYMYRTVKKADNIMVLTKSYHQDIKNIFHFPDNRILYMRLGMMSYPRLLKEQADNMNGAINFLYFGRIDGYKGLHTLASAYENLQNENVSLRVVGNGDFSDYENEYSKLKKVSVVNKYVEDTDVEKYFSVPNTVLVLPYLDATQSGVISIAFDFAVPVIATDVGGLKEQLFDGEVGMLCSPNAPDELFENMKIFVDNRKEYDIQHERMREYRKKMEWSYVTKELLIQLQERNK